MNQRGDTTTVTGYMHRFSHLLGVGTFFQARLGIGVDTVWTLHGVGDAKRDESFLTLRQGAFGKDRAVIAHELVPEFLIALAHVAAFMKIRRMIISIHASSEG